MAKQYIDGFFQRTHAWGTGSQLPGLTPVPRAVPGVSDLATLASNQTRNGGGADGGMAVGNVPDEEAGYADVMQAHTAPQPHAEPYEHSVDESHSMGNQTRVGRRGSGAVANASNATDGPGSSRYGNAARGLDHDDDMSSLGMSIDDLSDDDAEALMMDAEEGEWNRNLCSRILLVLQYATSTTSMLKDLRRVLCPSELSDRDRASMKHKKSDGYTPSGPSTPQARHKPREDGENITDKTPLMSQPDTSYQDGKGGADAALPAALSEEGKVMSKAFVTFRTMGAATVAQQVLATLSD